MRPGFRSGILGGASLSSAVEPHESQKNERTRARSSRTLLGLAEWDWDRSSFRSVVLFAERWTDDSPPQRWIYLVRRYLIVPLSDRILGKQYTIRRRVHLVRRPVAKAVRLSWPNKPAAGQRRLRLSGRFESRWPGVPERGRSAESSRL